jgi:DNA gyrase subunit A
MFVATNHQYMMFFTQKGNVSGCVFMKYQKEVRLQKRVQNLINIESDDKVKAFICTQDLKTKIIKSHNLIMVTKKRSG